MVKITTDQSKQDFQPLTITIVLETEQEVIESQHIGSHTANGIMQYLRCQAGVKYDTVYTHKAPTINLNERVITFDEACEVVGKSFGITGDEVMTVCAHHMNPPKRLGCGPRRGKSNS